MIIGDERRKKILEKIQKVESQITLLIIDQRRG